MKKEEKKDNAQKAKKGKEQGIEYFQDPNNYVNRELSWLEFDCRVLEEARDKTNPLFDRLKFLSITASNLDEFFMVRVASLKDMVHAGYKKPDIAGMTAQEQLDKIVFLNEGRVEAVGPHDQLYASCPEYRRMVDLQRLEDETKGGENA